MHAQNVAHRSVIHVPVLSSTYLYFSDCEVNNLMMDADALYPDGFHPIVTSFDPSFNRQVIPLPRNAGTVKYYFIDFGLAVDIAPPVEINKYVVGVFGRDGTVPELSLTQPYDAFKVDIYILGNMFRNILYNVRRVFSSRLWCSPLR